MDQQGSPCCYNFMKVAQSYHIKVTPIGALHDEKIDEAVFTMYLWIASVPLIRKEIVSIFFMRTKTQTRLEKTAGMVMFYFWGWIS